MGNLISHTPSTKYTKKTTLETNQSNTIENIEIDTPRCYGCNKTKGRDNTSLYPFHVKNETEKQMLCLDCYMEFCRQNRLFVPQETKKEEACDICKKVTFELYTRGMVQARLCGDCIDG
tara:strand:- start:295 stop:651 length:357 start_codon:yes stop_codon:yes gene_type:complete